MGDFILPIFNKAQLFFPGRISRLNQQIQKIAQEPEVLRQKLKGDYLMEHGKYVNAIKVYQKALFEKQEKHSSEQDQLGGQFVGGIIQYGMRLCETVLDGRGDWLLFQSI